MVNYKAVKDCQNGYGKVTVERSGKVYEIRNANNGVCKGNLIAICGDIFSVCNFNRKFGFMEIDL